MRKLDAAALPAALAALALFAAGCATPKQTPTAAQLAARPATLLGEVALDGPDGTAAAELKQTLRAAVRKELAAAGVNLVDDPAAPHARTLTLSVHVVYYGMEGVTSNATLALATGAAASGSVEHATGTHPREGEGKASFSLEPKSAEYPAHAAARLVGALLASPAGAGLIAE